MKDCNLLKKLFKPAAYILPAIIAPGILSCEKEAELKKPNVILIITDDQGYGDLGFTGNPWIRTPHMD